MHTGISWHKVDWGGFNTFVELLINQEKWHSPLSDDPFQGGYQQEKMLHHAYQLASRDLPWGCRPDPISWFTEEINEAILQQDKAWDQAKINDSEEAWTSFEELAKKVSNLF